LKEHKQLIMTP